MTKQNKPSVEIADEVETLIVRCRTIHLHHDVYKHELSEAKSIQQFNSIGMEWDKGMAPIVDAMRGAAILADERSVPSDAIWEAVLTVCSGKVSDRALGQLERLRMTDAKEKTRISPQHPTDQEIRELYEKMRKRFTVMKEALLRKYKSDAKKNGHGLDDIGFYRTVDSWVAYEKTPDKIVWYSLKPSDVKKLRSFFPANTLKK